MMRDAARQTELIAQGIQFNVLARAFPVLRHDALKPISNAKLASAMMQRAADEAFVHSEARTQQLLGDIDAMLDEGVATVRDLADWLCDSGKTVALSDLVRECVKMLFTDLLLSGKRVTVSEQIGTTGVALYAGRYVVLCWLLHIVEQAPDGSEIRVSLSREGQLHAALHVAAGSTVIRASDNVGAPITTFDACHALAAYHGWSLNGGQGNSTLTLPSVVQAGSVSRAA